MLITVRHEMRPHEILAPGSLDAIIGKVTTINWPGGPSKATIADAQIIEDGHAANITLDVTGRLQEFLARLLHNELSGFSIGGV